MNRNLFACVGVLLLAAASGCAMCDNSQDCTYGAYGGQWQRHDPCCGRVGSLIDPAGARVMPQQAQVDPSQQGDNAQQSVLAPEDGESLDLPSLDVEPLDEPTLDIDPVESAPAEVDVAPSDAKPVDLAPLDLAPADESMGIEPENAVPADVEPASELPDFLDDLGIKREPVEPLQPLDLGDLPPLVPSTDADD